MVFLPYGIVVPSFGQDANLTLNEPLHLYDNRISMFIAQYGKCAFLREELGINDGHCHHINPFHISKNNSYSNLIVLNKVIHKLNLMNLISLLYISPVLQ